MRNKDFCEDSHIIASLMAAHSVAPIGHFQH